MTEASALTDAVVYLDFDGVLHPADAYWDQEQGARLYEEAMSEGHRLFEHARLLEDLMAPYPSVGVVLSTTWALQLGCKVAASRLPPRLRERVVGTTYDLLEREDVAAYLEMDRGSQVLKDVARRQPKAWLAIDDDVEGWGSALEDHVVLCDRTRGISDDQVLARLAKMLERFRP